MGGGVVFGRLKGSVDGTGFFHGYRYCFFTFFLEARERTRLTLAIRVCPLPPPLLFSSQRQERGRVDSGDTRMSIAKLTEGKSGPGERGGGGAGGGVDGGRRGRRGGR